MPVSNQPKIKSIQRGTITLGSSQLSTNATIAAVDTAKTIIRQLGSTTTGTSPNFMRLWLTSSTQLGAIRMGAGAETTKVSYELTEYF
jgi:hypothetical protein